MSFFNLFLKLFKDGICFVLLSRSFHSFAPIMKCSLASGGIIHRYLEELSITSATFMFIIY